MIIIYQLPDTAEPLYLENKVIGQPAFIVRCGSIVIEIAELRISSIVRHSCLRPLLIGAVCSLEPGIACSQMLRNAKLKSLLFCRFLPGTNHIFFWSHVNCIPLVDL